MPRRHARRRRAPARPFIWETASLKARLGHLLELAGDDEDARVYALAYYRTPWDDEDNEPRKMIAYIRSPLYASIKEDTERSMRELRALARKDAAGTGKTRQSPHAGHAPPNSPTHDGWPPAPEPSEGSCAEAPPRPRALYL